MVESGFQKLKDKPWDFHFIKHGYQATSFGSLVLNYLEDVYLEDDKEAEPVEKEDLWS